MEKSLIALRVRVLSQPLACGIAGRKANLWNEYRNDVSQVNCVSMLCYSTDDGNQSLDLPIYKVTVGPCGPVHKIMDATLVVLCRMSRPF